jgi:transposase
MSARISGRDSSQCCSEVIVFQAGAGRERPRPLSWKEGSRPPMSIVAETFPFVVGVDTHARNHVYALVAAATGEMIEIREFPTSAAGIGRALTWVSRRTEHTRSVLWVIEGAASYGAILAGTVAAAGFEVAEAPRMDARAHHGVGKSDPLDAARIATAARATEVDRLRRPRLDSGVRAALRTLLAARDLMTREHTSAINALTALLRVHILGIDARRPLTADQIGVVARWHRRDEAIEQDTARAEAIRLARRIGALDAELATNKARMTELIEISQAAPLLDKTGIGPVSAATFLTAYSHDGRLHSEAAFAAMAGVNPIPASSGNTVRHRLNRGGDRRINHMLHIVATVRMIYDPETKAYVAKRRAEGKTTKEIRRIIKRYLARQIYRILSATNPTPNPA